MRRAVRAGVAAALVAAAIGMRDRVDSIGSVLAIVAVVLAIACGIRMTRSARSALVVAAVAFIPWLAVRTSAWLLVPDAIAALVTMLVALSVRNGGSLADSAAGYRRRLQHALIGAFDAPPSAWAAVSSGNTRWHRRLRPLAGPGAIGLCLAAIVAATLASGDALFASYLTPGDWADSLGARIAAALVAMTAVVVGMGVGVHSEARDALAAVRWARPRSAIVAVAPMCVVYIVYVLVQCSTLLLGADYVRDRTGLTFAEYARSGFFQLVAVALLTFVALNVLRPISRVADRRERLTMCVLGTVATACTVAMVVAAIVKLQLYSDVFGLTMLRVYTTVFAAWLGVALMIAWWALRRLDGEWVIGAVAATALVGVFAMNVVNPERVVAEYNLTHTIDSPEFDVRYVLGLSDDAVPAVAARLDGLDDESRREAVAMLCARTSRSVEQRETTGLDWNRAADAAARIRADLCVTTDA